MATGTSHATVGSIDYSAYVGAGEYCSGIDGIAAKANGTIIDVDATQGCRQVVRFVRRYGHRRQQRSECHRREPYHKGDIILLQDVRTPVSDSGGVVTAPQASVNSIIGIHTGDVVGFAAGNYGTGFGLTGATPPTQAGASTCANFLAAAGLPSIPMASPSALRTSAATPTSGNEPWRPRCRGRGSDGDPYLHGRRQRVPAGFAT